MTTLAPAPVPSAAAAQDKPEAAVRQRGTNEFRSLNPHRVVETIGRLESRIRERFPSASLVTVASELSELSVEAVRRSRDFRRPYLFLRSVIWLLVLGIIVALVPVGSSLRLHSEELFQVEHFLQTFEAGLGSAVFIGAAIVFLISLENRWKRQRLLDAIRELRSIAHIVDMHQLTKDPEAVIHGGPRTQSSPKRNLSKFELGRYLDYCSELLSLISKLGAVYVQEFPDTQAVAAADELANLTNGLSRSIWQKIMILDKALEEPSRASQSPPAVE